MKAATSDFNGSYKGYWVASGRSAAYKKGMASREVFISNQHSTALTTTDAQALYGDTVAKRVTGRMGKRIWPDHPVLMQSTMHVIALGLTFKEVSALQGFAAAKDKPGDEVASTFNQMAKDRGLRPVKQFFIIPSCFIREDGDYHETGKDMTAEDMAKTVADTLFSRTENLILSCTESESLLPSAHLAMLLGESVNPGYMNKADGYVLAGLYEGESEALPESAWPEKIREQNEPPIVYVARELARLKF